MRKPYENEPSVVIDYTEFTYADKALVAEASTFKGREIHFDIYTDAADRGIAIRGRTGKIVVFHLSHENIINGEITHWEYRPTKESKARVPQCIHNVVRIFND